MSKENNIKRKDEVKKKEKFTYKRGKRKEYILQYVKDREIYITIREEKEK